MNQTGELKLAFWLSIKWANSTIELSVGGEPVTDALYTKEDKKFTIEFNDHVVHKEIKISGLQVSFTDVDTVDLEISEGSDKMGIIQNKINVGSASIRTENEENIIWRITENRDNILSEIHINGTNRWWN